MTEKDEAMLLRTSEMAMKNLEMMMQRGLQLVQSQMEIIQGATSDIGGQYRSLMTAEDAATGLRAWPSVLENTHRRAAEGMTAYLQNAVQFQTELFQMMQSRMAELNTQFSEDLSRRMRTETAHQIPISGGSSGHKEPTLRSVKARKAA